MSDFPYDGPDEAISTGQWPTGELPPSVHAGDGPALDELAAAGWGEGDHDGDHHGTPADLVELFEAIELADAGVDMTGGGDR